MNDCPKTGLRGDAAADEVRSQPAWKTGADWDRLLRRLDGRFHSDMTAPLRGGSCLGLAATNRSGAAVLERVYWPIPGNEAIQVKRHVR